MKALLSSLPLLLVGVAQGETFSVGGESLEVPAPPGFTRLTPEMGAVYRLSEQFSAPENEQLACYIADADVPRALSGEISSLERYYLLSVNKKLKSMSVGLQEFAELKSTVKRDNGRILESVKAQMPNRLEEVNKGIHNEFDVDVALKLSQIVPLDPHYETDTAIAYSMYINYGAAFGGAEKDFTVAATATFVNVAGKILFLYCYGPPGDLEWTRSAAQAWEEKVIAGNAPPPARSSGGRGFDMGKVLQKGLIGGLAGALIALVFGVLSSLRKKEKKD